MENYSSLKERLVAAASRPIVGDDDDWCRDVSDRLRLANRTWVDVISARSREPSGWYAVGTELVARAPWTGPLGTFADLADATALRGRHNIQNALAASAAAMILGVGPRDVAEGLRTFPGLAHRLEVIGTQGRTLFVNDSKATNADSTENALAAFEDGIYWILGGKPKEGGITSLKGYFPRVAKAYLIGQAAPEFAATLQSAVPFEMSGTLDAAIAAAAQDAAKSGHRQPVVLLSPACASYDQFPNFEVRGEAFRSLVGDLPGVALKPRGQTST
jgi:UDP-N-acetylmuramoylalanine--D-glutamate ligase